ncbi:MAG: protein kinase [Phycisphaerales bacterium]|nr:protein kinase [Phycisphaerales bacterium]
MDPKWRRIKDIFEQIVEAAPSERDALLRDACGGDDDLRAEVEALLARDAGPGARFLDPPPTEPSPTDHGPLGARAPGWATRLINRKVGRYAIVRALGHGGMGCVFEATQERPSRSVALKIVHPGLSAPSALARFRLESEILGRLQHPNIAQVYEAGVHEADDGPIPFFAMELVPGAKKLRDYATERELTVPQLLELFIKVCDAVHHGHQKGVIHRDLKPANILVGGDGEPKIIDFGIAATSDADIMMTQQTRTGDLIGTLRYMSPEQVTGDRRQIDARSDIYSLGFVLYELLTGRAPYDTSGIDAYRAIQQDEPRRPSTIDRRLRGDIEAILLKALEKSPERRYESAAAFAKDLRAYLNGDPVSASVPGPADRIGRYIQRRPWQATTIAASLLVLALASVTVVVWRAWGEAQSAAALAQSATDRAKKEADRATRLARESRTAKLLAVDAALSSNDPATAKKLIEKTKALLEELGEETTPWEIRHLASRVDQSLSTRNKGDTLLTPGEIGFAVEPNGTRVAIARPDGSLAIADFEATDNDSETILADKRRPCKAVAWSHDGTFLAASPREGGPDRCVRIWRGANLVGDPTANLDLPADSMGTLAFHPKQPILAIDGRRTEDGKPGEILLWNLANVEMNPHDYKRVATPTSKNESIAWSADGGLIATAKLEDNEIHVLYCPEWADIGESLRGVTLQAHTHHVMDLAFAPSGSGRILASASMDETVRLWDLSQLPKPQDADSINLEPFDVLRGHGGGAKCVCFDPWGRRLFVGDLERTIHVWDVENIEDREAPTPIRARVNTLRGHETAVYRVQALRDGLLASMSSDGAVKLWAPDTEDVPVLRGHTSSVQAVHFTCGALFAVDGAANLIEWDPKTCVPRRSWKLQRYPTDMAMLRVASDLVEAVVTYSDPKGPSEVAIVTLSEGAPQTTSVCAEPDAGVFSWIAHSRVDANGQFRRLVVGLKHAAKLLVWNRGADGWGEPNTLDLEGAGGNVYSIVALDPNARWVAVSVVPEGGADPTQSFFVLDVTNGTKFKTPFEESKSKSARLAYREPRGGSAGLLAVGTRGGDILLFEVSNGGHDVTLRLFGTLEGHSHSVTALAFHPKEPRLVSSAEFEPLRVWDLNTKTEVATLHGHPYHASCLTFDPNGRWLASGSTGGLGGDNVVRLWEAPTVLGDPSNRTVAERNAMIDRANAMRAASEARRLLRTMKTVDEVVDLMRDDPTLPEAIRGLATRDFVAGLPIPDRHPEKK